ncbi:hypothetical protein SNE40_013270 [Patella caerulea]|uniref:Ribosome-binding factor A, mitochondrial n=1 Tax=Patella caerulea TaxID=87958 RepID=A0AAN8PKX4_PATCE
MLQQLMTKVCPSSYLMQWSLIVVRFKSTNVPMVKIMRKVIEKSNKSKKKSYNVLHWTQTNIRLVDKEKRGFTDGQINRAQHIGKVLYRYLIDLINSGELSSYLTQYGVNITRVKVVPDLSSMNIYWSVASSEKEDDIEEKLRASQGKLRHLLTSYHIISHVPYITFVKDKEVGNALLVEELLKTADFGPDYVPKVIVTPVCEAGLFNYSPTLNEKFRKLSLDYEVDSHTTIKDPLISDVTQIKKLLNESEYSYTDDMRVVSDNYHNEDSTNLNNLSVNGHVSQSVDINLRNDLYGVNHDDMMKSLLLKKKKSKHRTSQNGDLPSLNNSITDYKKLAQTLKKPKVLKAKHLMQQYEMESLRAMREEQMQKEELEKEMQEEELYVDIVEYENETKLEEYDFPDPKNP